MDIKKEITDDDKEREQKMRLRPWLKNKVYKELLTRCKKESAAAGLVYRYLNPVVYSNQCTMMIYFDILVNR